MPHRSTREGFKLIEVLVVIGIIGLLVAILLPGLGSARSAARQTVDLSNLRQIMVAYSVYQDDHDGHVMWGYPLPTVNGIAIEARFSDGSLVPGLDARRYPWHQHPYLNDNWALLYSNAGLSDDDYDDWYSLSLTPSFGRNTTHVGGHTVSPRHGFVVDASGAQRPNCNSHVVFNQIEVRNVSNLLVFACPGVASRWSRSRWATTTSAHAPSSNDE
ncbi:MAG: type II secretion system protein [Planctomycetota bacterium]